MSLSVTKLWKVPLLFTARSLTREIWEENKAPSSYRSKTTCNKLIIFFPEVLFKIFLPLN